MQKQPILAAITTADLLHDLALAEDEAKFSFRDLFMSTSQVATAIGLCWMVHLFV